MHNLVVFCAKYLFAVAPAAVLIVWLASDNKIRRSLFMRSLAAGVLSTAFAYIAGSLWFEQRPFVLQHLTPLIPHVADNGFPSDHVLTAATCAFLLFTYSRPAAITAGVVTLIVAWARIACLLHSPIDMVASVVFAAMAAFLAAKMVRRREKNYDLYPDRKERAEKLARVEKALAKKREETDLTGAAR